MTVTDTRLMAAGVDARPPVVILPTPSQGAHP